MAGYLDSYGAGDQKREQVTKRVVLGALLVVMAGLVVYLALHNFQEKRAFNRFFSALSAGNYQEAYRLWGCTAATPCRDYDYSKFLEDWGPKGQYGNVKAGHVTIVDSCGGGVVMTLEYPNTEPFGVWVDRGTKALSFAPWPRCPGGHWHFWEFITRQFS